MNSEQPRKLPTRKEIEDLNARALESARKMIAQEGTAFLVKAGIYSPEGELTPEYGGPKPRQTLRRTNPTLERMKAKPEQRWKTTKQLAARYQLSVRMIAYLTTDGVLPCYKVGHTLRFDPVECDEAMKAFRRASRFDPSHESR